MGGRRFTNEIRKAFSIKKREEHIARARWAVSNEGIRLRSLASDLAQFEEFKEPKVKLVVSQHLPTEFGGAHTEKLTWPDLAGVPADELRLMRNQACRKIGKIGKQLHVLGASHVMRGWLHEEQRLLSTNCTTVTNVLLDMKEPLTRPKALPTLEEGVS